MGVDASGWHPVEACAAVRREAFDIGRDVADAWRDGAIVAAPILQEDDPRWVPGELKTNIRRGELVERPGGGYFEITSSYPQRPMIPQWLEFGTRKMRARPYFRVGMTIARARLMF